MGKEIGPRERALREQREAKYTAEQARQKADRGSVLRQLRGDVVEASKKTGKSIKRRKK